MIWSRIREPDDRLANVRISLGTKSRLGSYMVFRGDPEKVIDLLEEAVVEARRTLLKGDYKDNRGRPQG